MAYAALSADDVLDNLPDAILVLDGLGNIEFANHAFLGMLGYHEEELLNRNILHFLADDAVFDSCMIDLKKQGYCLDQETLFLHKDGSIVTTIKSVRMIDTAEEHHLLVNIRNITDIDTLNRELDLSKREALEQAGVLAALVDSKEKELILAKMQLDEVLGAINEIIWYIDDKDLTVHYVSEAVEPIFGVDKLAFIQQPRLWQEMIHADDRQMMESFFQTLQPGSTRTVEFRIERPDGEMRWLNNRIIHHPSMELFIGVTFDITDSKNTQDMIEFLAYHDSLTKLPNRINLKEQMEKMLVQTKTLRHAMAVMFLDLDNFKYINDSMGHEIGDEILIEVASRLNGALEEKALCARFGGDEFIILLSDTKETSRIEQTASRLIRCFEKPFLVRDHEYFISGSIGISLYPQHAATTTDLIKHADTAMYQAKKEGKNRYTFYDTAMDAYVKEFLRIENLIREGIKHNYFALHFQPLIDASEHTLKGFEALLRLEHPEADDLSPEKFIPVAEATGDIMQLSKFVLKETCRFSRELNALSDTELFIAVNISARQFQDANFTQMFLACIKENGISSSAIKVELTESVIMEDLEHATAQLTRLKDAGIQAALDDFGTGYSSFEYLAKLPISTIKIDKSFVIGLFENEQNRHIIEAMTTLAHAMSMKVTAEGVESSEHAEYLRRQGVDILQGFHISGSLPPKTILQNIEAKRPFFGPSRHGLASTPSSAHLPAFSKQQDLV
jgi:diguanylate cyclase (GGDEF)-like protein/PAS domain S-box-containing protein